MYSFFQIGNLKSLCIQAISEGLLETDGEKGLFNMYKGS